VLVKGSRGVGLELVLERLRAAGESMPVDLGSPGTANADPASAVGTVAERR
jgi:hypothetical protein